MSTTGPVSRRRFVGAVGAAGLGLGAVRAAPLPPGVRPEPLLELELCLQAARRGPRRARIISGGTFHGPGLTGTVDGGGVWVIARSDGFDEVTVQATLRTADQQSISVRSRGLVDRGRDATDNTRATPIFDTASARYAWLNRLVAVAAGDTHADRMRYQIYRIG